MVLEDVFSDFKNITLLTLDIQGAELQALRGAGRELAKVKAIFTEVNFEKVYKDCALIDELDSYLGGFGFKRVLTFRTQAGWGDALYLSKNARNRISPTLWATRIRLHIRWILEWGSPKLRKLLASKRKDKSS